MEDKKQYLKIGSLRIQRSKILFFNLESGHIELVLENYLRRIIITETQDPQSRTEFDVCVPYDITVKLPTALYKELGIYLATESQRLSGDQEEI